jgi:hypothetical protein
MGNRILVKLRPSIGLAAADPKVNLRPLYGKTPATNVFGIADAPTWYLAGLPDTTGPNPWDLAHAQIIILPAKTFRNGFLSISDLPITGLKPRC